MSIKKFRRQIALSLIVVFLLVAERYSFLGQKERLIETNISAYQQTELEIICSVVSNIEQYVTYETEIKGLLNQSELEQDIVEKFIAPVHLLDSGKAWIYAPDHVVFNLSKDFSKKNHGKSITEIFAIQESKGASHYNEITLDVREAREGQGWYIWLPDEGKEIAAWSPVRANEYIWTVGMSIPLSEILESTGAARQIKILNVFEWLNGFLLLSLYLLWLFSIIRQEKTNEKLHVRENYFTNSFKSSTTGMAMTRMDGRFLLVNAALCKIFGYTSVELQAKTLRDITYPEDAQKSTVYLRRLLRGEIDSFDDEKRYIKKDGSVFWAEIRVSAVKNEEGDLQYLFRHIIDITERKKTEEERKKLYQAVEQSANLVVITDVDGVIKYVNPKFVDVTGYSIEEALGEKPSILKSGEHDDSYYKNLWGTVSSGKEWHGEFCNKRKDGSLYWEQASIAPVFDDTGEIINFIAVKEDITKQRDIEQALQKSYRELETKVEERTADLKESEEKYRLLAELIKDVIIRLSPKGEILFMSSAIKYFGGYIPEDEVGQNMEKYFARKKDIDPANELLAKITATKQSGRGEFLFNPQKGKPFPVEFTYLPLVEKNKVIAIQLVLRDITERKQAEQELIKNEKRYRNLFDLLPYGAEVVDLDGYITDCNLNTANILGYERDELIGKHLTSILTPEATDVFNQKRHLVMKGNIVRGDIEMVRKDGNIINVLRLGQPIYDSEGKVSSLLAVNVDITRRKRIESELKRRESYLSALNEASQELLLSEAEIPYQTFLNIIGSSSQASRAYIFLNHIGPDGERLTSQIAAWHVKGIQPEIDISKWQNISYDKNFSKGYVMLSQNNIVSGRASSFTGVEKQIFDSQNIKAILIIPLMVDEEFVGFLGFDNCISDSEWDMSERDYLFAAARDLSLAIKRDRAEQTLRRQATTDPLTRLFNRRHFFNLAQIELERSQRYNRPLSIIIFDIDHFKKVNDTYGHGVGDEVLCKLSEKCQDVLRENDIIARYGGEEFVILLPETNLEQAEQMAERMRKDCAETPMDIGLVTVNLTISFGVSSLGDENLLLDELLLRADTTLYEAKENGRNRVCIWDTKHRARG